MSQRDIYRTVISCISDQKGAAFDPYLCRIVGHEMLLLNAAIG